jgi:hypothetical protein
MSEQGAPPVETSPAPETAREPKVIEVGDDSFSLTGADPEADPEEPARPSRTRRIVLSSLLAVGLAGATVLAYVGWTISSQKDATLTTPAAVAGLRLDTSADGKSTADYLRTALAAEVQLDRAVGAVYADGSESVLFLGGTGLIWTPENDLDTAFDLISDDQGAVTGLHKVPAGKLGGTMKCGTTKTDDGSMSVCGWADHGSLALAMFPSRTESDAATLLVQIRDAAQTRD